MDNNNTSQPNAQNGQSEAASTLRKGSAPMHKPKWQSQLEEPQRATSHLKHFENSITAFSVGALAGTITHEVKMHKAGNRVFLGAFKNMFSRESYTKEAFAHEWKTEILPELKYVMAGGTIAVALGAVYTWHKNRQNEKSSAQSDTPTADTARPIDRSDSFAGNEAARRATPPHDNQRNR